MMIKVKDEQDLFNATQSGILSQQDGSRLLQKQNEIDQLQAEARQRAGMH